tara:strand:+ start:211076 stop:211762 length:687 start_codon:yes stop_codon:yes gene_type:complete
MIKHLLISFFALSITAAAQAGIILSGNIDDTNPLPTSLALNALPESNTNIFLYTEQEDFLLTSDLNVDYMGSTNAASVISSGTKVNSFFLNFDAVGSGTVNSFNGVGSYLFDTEILGIIWSGTRPYAQNLIVPSSGFLDLSDGILGLAGTTYATYAIGRGLEPEAFFNSNNTADKVTVSGSQLDLSLFVKPLYADQLRVITAVKVPEPTTLLLFGTAVICLVNLRRFS